MCADFANTSQSPSAVGRVVLPSSVPGTPRYMNQLLGDALALCREHGKPDMFITMTCNPMWPEIQENLRECCLY